MVVENNKPMDETCEDEFEDAIEATELDAINALQIDSIENEDKLNPSSLEEALQEIHHCLVIALDNQFEEALKITQQKSSYSIYHSVGQTFLYFLKGVLTMEKEQMEKALESATQLFDLCSKKKRQHYLGVIWRPNYNNYTDIEVHSELCYAESLLMVALLTFLENQSLINLVKGAFRIRSCYQAYKECLNILNTKCNWQSERSRRDFEAGVRMGVGTFNLMMSHLPSKVIKVLEFIGFSGNRSQGLQEIEISVSMKDCLRSPISALISATYHCYIEHYFGLGNGDVEYVDKMLNKWLTRYPKSAFFLLFNGRISVLKGELNQAISSFEQCISIQQEWKQLHNICYWELLWCHCIKCDWKDALKYADILRLQCAWSPAIYTYQAAIFLHMIQDETNDESLLPEIKKLYKEVPKLRIRYAGKTIPAEKFAITHAEKFFVSGDHLLLPAFEYFYIWNIFAIIEKDKSLIDPILERIELKITKYNYELDGENSTDNYCLLMLLKGVCLRVLGYYYQSIECFQQLLKLEKRIKNSNYLPPHCAMELGLTYIKLDELDLANYWFEKAKKDYTGYLLETLLHFRVHCGQRVIKHMKKIRLSSQEVLTKESIEEIIESTDIKETETSTHINLDDKLKQINKMKIKFSEKLKIDEKNIAYIEESENASNKL